MVVGSSGAHLVRNHTFDFGVRLVNHLYDFRHHWTPQCPVINLL